MNPPTPKLKEQSVGRKPSRPILRYHGGKWKLAPWIIAHFPKHRVYVEPFGGGASVLLRKERSYAEVYNDLDGEVVNLFLVTRERGEELRERLALTPFARKEYENAWLPSSDPLEQARRTVIRAFMGFGSAAVTMARKVDRTRGGSPGTGFRSNSNRSGTTPAHDWVNLGGSPRTGFKHYLGNNRHSTVVSDFAGIPGALVATVQRLQGVVIENKDANDVIRDHDSTLTLFYADPPYPAEVRDRGIDYVHEMSDDDHRQLAQVLRSVKGMVVLSGYPCDLYDKELYPDWHRETRQSLADGARKRTEVLWLNEACAKNLNQGKLQFSPEAL